MLTCYVEIVKFIYINSDIHLRQMPKKDNNPKLLPTAESQNKVSFSCCSYSVKKKYIEGFCLLFQIAKSIY